MIASRSTAATECRRLRSSSRARTEAPRAQLRAVLLGRFELLGLFTAVGPRAYCIHFDLIAYTPYTELSFAVKPKGRPTERRASGNARGPVKPLPGATATSRT